MFANIWATPAKAIAPDPAAREAWMEAQKEALKSGAPRRGPASARRTSRTSPKRATNTRRCEHAIAILSARASQLKYREALAEGLPIGSGEIESAHRYVAQKRLKLPGAWWRVEHAEHMLALRINRMNGDWDDYWKALAQQRAQAANDNSPDKSRRRTA